MEIIIYLAIGLIIGAAIGWLLTKAKTSATVQAAKDAERLKYSELDRDFASHKATVTSQLETTKEALETRQNEIAGLEEALQEKAEDLFKQNSQLSTFSADLRAANQTILDKNEEIKAIKEELRLAKNDLSASNQTLATAKANNEALDEKLQTQKEEIEALGKKFNTEFENIANKILETKTEKFTKINSENLKVILDPLGKHLTEFKTKVEEVYDKEAKERFSLGERVKELAQLNQVISEEARI